VARSIDYFRDQPFARPVDRVVLAGGTALCAGMDRYMQQAIGIPVEIGNPMRHVDAGIPVERDVAARAAVAVGLALDDGSGR
jgi:Tfp pilus assembly PilM family ATPase